MRAGSPDIVREAAFAGCGAGPTGAVCARRDVPVDPVVFLNPRIVSLTKWV